MAIRSLKTGSFSRSTQVGNQVIMPGSYESIATVPVGAGGQSSIIFTSIPATFQHLQIRLFSKNSTDNGTVGMRYNSDSGANYSYHDVYGSGASAGALSAANQTTLFACLTGSTQAAVSVIDILDYADTNKFKTNRCFIGVDYNGSGYSWLSSGNWRSTAAITSITLNATFNQYTHAALYGVK
jgi:hypothetical protein